MRAHIDIPRERIAEFCKKYHMRRLSLFGSVLREDFRPDSDVDVLVEFEPDHVPGFFGIAHMEQELSAIFGRKVDLRTPEDLSRYFRQGVLALYRRWCEEGDAFMPWYLELLSTGGSEAPATMLARVGIDVRNPTFWKRGLEHVGNLIDQFETVAYA